MKIKRQEVAKSIEAVLHCFSIYGTDGTVEQSGLERAYCVDCGSALSDDQDGCDTCFPVKQILYKGYP